MTRAVIYARFSTELQNEKSTEDQIALCRAYADRQMIDVVAIFQDNGEAPEIRIAGHLESLVKMDVLDRRSSAGGQVVAGEGLEPPTPGL